MRSDYFPLQLYPTNRLLKNSKRHLIPKDYLRLYLDQTLPRTEEREHLRGEPSISLLLRCCLCHGFRWLGCETWASCGSGASCSASTTLKSKSESLSLPNDLNLPFPNPSKLFSSPESPKSYATS